MTYKVRYVEPGWTLSVWESPYLKLWHIRAREPLTTVWWVWEAPALRTYSAATRGVLTQALWERQPDKIAALKRLGYSWSWETSLEGLVGVLSGLTEHLREALSIAWELLAAPNFYAAQIQAVVKRLAQDQRRLLASSAYRATAYLKERLWGASYAATMSPEAILALDPEEVIRFYEAVFRRTLRHIILVGPHWPKGLERWHSWAQPFSYQLLVGGPQGGWQIEADEAANQASVRLAFPWVSSAHPQYAAYRLALLGLGGYFGSRLMQEIREKGGYTYGIYARRWETLADSYFVIESELDKARATEALEAIQRVVRDWARRPFEEERAFLEAQNYLIAHLLIESARSWGARLAHLLLEGRSPAWYVAQGHVIEALTLSDLAKLGLEDTLVSGVVVGASQAIFAA